MVDPLNFSESLNSSISYATWHTMVIIKESSIEIHLLCSTDKSIYLNKIFHKTKYIFCRDNHVYENVRLMKIVKARKNTVCVMDFVECHV